MEEEKSGKKKKGSIIQTVILVIAIICFLGSGGYLLNYYITGWKAEQKISDLKALIIDDAVFDTLAEGETEAEDVVRVNPRYQRLLEANSDFIGWVSIKDTDLSYPVMYTPDDPEKYLHLNFDQEYEYSGLPFVDSNCSVQPPGTNIIIYGHNMKNKTMFSVLESYKDQEFYNTHKYVTFDTIYGDGVYEIVYVILSKAYSANSSAFKYYTFIQSDTEDEFENFMDQFRKLQIYDTGLEGEFGDQFITLSTCEYSQNDGRIALIARKIDSIPQETQSETTDSSNDVLPENQ